MIPWYRSKTVWFNVLYLLVVLAGSFGFGNFTPSDDVQQIAVIIPLVVNLLLRLLGAPKPVATFWK